jgi:hypothetical protein
VLLVLQAGLDYKDLMVCRAYQALQVVWVSLAVWVYLDSQVVRD